MYAPKPAFEQYRRQVILTGKPLREKEVAVIQPVVEKSFDAIADLLVEKVRRVPFPPAEAETVRRAMQEHSMLEISARWIGMDAEQAKAVMALRRQWSDDCLSAQTARFHVLEHDDVVYLAFIGSYEASRYLTGRVKITF